MEEDASIHFASNEAEFSRLKGADDVERLWAKRVGLFLKVELKRRELSYVQLAERMNRRGWNETAQSLNNKVNRGKFTAAFFVAALNALQRDTLAINELEALAASDACKESPQ